MRNGFAAVLVLVAAVVPAGAASAANVTVQIRSGGFSPSSVTVSHGDAVVWHVADRTNHRIVADNGSFASPILHPGQSWGVVLDPGTVRYHDGLAPRFRGTVTVKPPPPPPPPPPTMTLGVSVPIVYYGDQATLTGTISTGEANQSVELDAQPWGQPSAVKLAVVTTGGGGAFALPVKPSIYTTYVARWNGIQSGNVVVQVAPRVLLRVGRHGYMRVAVTSPVSLWHRHVLLQRLSSLGQWVDLAALTLGRYNARLFQPRAYLPKGTSKIRVFLSINQAGNGLLAAHSGTRVIRR
jgi:plastocyanin